MKLLRDTYGCDLAASLLQLVLQLLLLKENIATLFEITSYSSFLRGPGGRFTKNLKITIHTWDLFILLEKHHQCHCMLTNYSYDYI